MFFLYQTFHYYNHCIIYFCSEPAEAVMPVEEDAEEYNMKHKRRGKAVIFNHDKFANDSAKPRVGSHVDVQSLEITYKALDFEVTTYNNLSHSEIRNVINACKCLKSSEKQVLINCSQCDVIIQTI